MRMRLPRWVSERTICRSGSKNAMFPPMTIVRVFGGSQRANSGLRDVACARRHGLMRVVFDTSVLVAAARSRDGASYALVSSIPSPQFEISLSIGLYAEWQDVLSRPEHLPPGQTSADALGFLRFLASQARLQDIFFLWRPYLPDPDDDMILELAFAANCRYIVTHNMKDFRGCQQLGVEAITPREFLAIVTSTSAT